MQTAPAISRKALVLLRIEHDIDRLRAWLVADPREFVLTGVQRLVFEQAIAALNAQLGHVKQHWTDDGPAPVP